MNPIVRCALLAGGVAALAACDTTAFDKAGIDYKSVQAQSQAQPQGTAFQRSLTQGYTDFARWEVEQGDYRDGKYNLDKARVAMAG